MKIKFYKELVFRIVNDKVMIQDEELKFLDNFIFNFVEKNDWLVGGSFSSGFILYDEKNKTDMVLMREKLLKYLKRQKSIKITSVVFQTYDPKIEDSDFIDIEEVKL